MVGAVGAVGAAVGAAVVGAFVVGAAVGAFVVGAAVGAFVGVFVVGTFVGAMVVGSMVGENPIAASVASTHTAKRKRSRISVSFYSHTFYSNLSAQLFDAQYDCSRQPMDWAGGADGAGVHEEGDA